MCVCVVFSFLIVLLVENGTILAWGCNTYGQLGVPSDRKVNASSSAATCESGLLREHDRGQWCCESAAKKIIIPGLPAVTAVACGLRHSIALAGKWNGSFTTSDVSGIELSCN